jgi:hypothetical protein
MARPIRRRSDGFYEVSGVAGYHRLDDAKRVAEQTDVEGFRPSGTVFGTDDENIVADDAHTSSRKRRASSDQGDANQ